MVDKTRDLQLGIRLRLHVEVRKTRQVFVLAVHILLLAHANLIQIRTGVG